MRCLCCGKEFSPKATEYELTVSWHQSCIKKFFGTKVLPNLDISKEKLEELARKSIIKGYTIPGVQKKLSLYLTNDDGSAPRLTFVNYPSGYILKPQTPEFEALPEAEHLVMSMAVATRIRTVPFALVRLEEGEFAYITKRIDRLKSSNGVLKYAMEDFCQLENRLTADKYRGSYERCSKILEAYSYDVGLDKTDLFLRLVFSFVVGNSDMHLKNFSLIEKDVNSGMYHLSDAYDMLPVNVIMPSDKEEVALTLNGKKQNIRRKDFLIFAENCGIQKKSAEKMIAKVVSLKETYIAMCRESLMPQHMKENLENLINKRIEQIQ